MRSAEPFVYKREQHFRQWLERLQGKELREIPQVVYEAVEREISGIRRDQVNEEVVKAILKSLNLRQYLKHATKIYCRLTGRAAPFSFSPEEEDHLVRLFVEGNKKTGQLPYMLLVIDFYKVQKEKEKMKRSAKL